MKFKQAARAIYRNDCWLQWALLGFMLAYYGVVLSDLGMAPAPEPLNLTFNSMLQHLMHGQFNVDPGTVGNEGFLRNGLVYSYWGIWCALLRLPLLLIRRLDVNMTTWSCLVAVCVAGMMKVRTVLLIRRRYARAGTEWIFGLMLVYVVLGGSAVAYLKSSIFQEIVFWAAAFGAVFVYFMVKAVVSGGFSTQTLTWMAVAAGLALLTRVSTGIGLCMAFGLLLAVLLLEDVGTARRMVVPVAALAVLLVATGTVNYFRWGHATTFADHTLYIMNRLYPDRMPRTHLYGYFNMRRIPFGLLYYFLPLWVLRGGAGRLLFESTHTRLMDAVELPPSSFFLTDLLPMVFIGVLIYALWTRRAAVLQPMSRWLAVAAGLAAPCMLMLMAISMNYRYRMEFYPEMDLLAFLGVCATVSDETLLEKLTRRRQWVTSATVVSVVMAFVLMILYKLSAWGPSQDLLRAGLVQYYIGEVRQFLQ